MKTLSMNEIQQVNGGTLEASGTIGTTDGGASRIAEAKTFVVGTMLININPEVGDATIFICDETGPFIGCHIEKEIVDQLIAYQV